MTWVMRRAPSAPDVPPRARIDLAEPDDRAHQGRALGHGESRQPRPTMASARPVARSATAWPRASMRRPPTAPQGSATFRSRHRADRREKRDHGMEVVQRFVRAFTYENMPWREAQEAGPALGAAAQAARERASTRTGSRAAASPTSSTRSWAAPSATRPASGSRRPRRLVGRPARAAAQRGHRSPIAPAPSSAIAPVIAADARLSANEPLSTRGKPFPLHGIRILDFTWFLASAGGTRFLARVRRREHQGGAEEPSRYAARRDGAGRRTRSARQGDRAAARRDRHGHGRPVQQQEPRQARHLAQRARTRKGSRSRSALVAMSDIVAEGFSPGVLDSWGLGYDALQPIKPDIIYVQQSGMGAQGQLRPLPHRRPDRERVRRLVGDVGAARAGDAGRLGLLLSRLDGRVQLRARDAERALPSQPHRRRAVDRRVADARSASSSTARRCSTGRRTDASGRATATARRTSRRRRTASIRAPATTAGSRSPASTMPNGSALAEVAGRPRVARPTRGSRRWPRGSRIRMRSTRRSRDWTRTREDVSDACIALQAPALPAGVCQTAGDRCDHRPAARGARVADRSDRHEDRHAGRSPRCRSS